jgi:hypothetical protein
MWWNIVAIPVLGDDPSPTSLDEMIVDCFAWADLA